jgi:arylsulfatase A-like enzyme
VLKKLDEIGARESTVVIVTADQGWNAGHHGVWGKGNGTWPYNMYEESIRVPMVWSHPGRIRSGATMDAMVSSYDLFPTLLDYAGIAAPAADRSRPGISYAPELLGKSSRRQRDRLYYEYSHVRAVRTPNLKYIERATGMPSELYDLEADGSESRNVLEDPAYSRRLSDLRSDLRRFFRGIGAPALDDWRTTTKQRIPPRGPAAAKPAV